MSICVIPPKNGKRPCRKSIRCVITGKLTYSPGLTENGRQSLMQTTAIGLMSRNITARRIIGNARVYSTNYSLNLCFANSYKALEQAGYTKPACKFSGFLLESIDQFFLSLSLSVLKIFYKLCNQLHSAINAKNTAVDRQIVTL